jgi:membrane fusion protein (multidrug efflux system)
MEPTIPTQPDVTNPPRQSLGIPVVVATAVVLVLALGGALIWHAESKTNKVALASEPKPVTVVKATASTFRPSRAYVGRLDPWVSANVGPQFVAAYVDTVLVRPGAVVRKGQVLATLDCRNASATAQAIEMQARALDAQQKALADESSRVSGLLDGGFVSPNEAEQKSAQSASKQAEVLAQKAKLLGTSLEVNDCVLRAPFDGEISTRSIDPGAFARPSTTIVSIVDRTTVRMTADAPETDFNVVSPGTKVTIHTYATNKDFSGVIGRRAPAADVDTRTVHFEIDIPDPQRQIPVGTTGEVRVDVGEPVPATELPLSAATVRGLKGSVFVVDADIARKRTVSVLGEIGGSLFVDRELKPGERIVTEGRALLEDNDRVTALEAPAAPAAPTASTTAKENKP